MRCKQRKLTDAQLCANEQWHDRSDNQLGADLDSEGGKSRKRAENQIKERKTMDEKLIIAASGFPELYDGSLFVYKNNRKKRGKKRKKFLKNTPLNGDYW